MHGDLSYIYFTCVHCGGVRRQVAREYSAGEGYPAVLTVTAIEQIVAPRRPCYHQSWDEDGWNHLEIESALASAPQPQEDGE